METADCCIGVISWFPSDDRRVTRVERCRRLIADCDRIFGLPIVVVAQDWKNEIISANLIRYDSAKLGITAARKKLWEIFRASAYDWMILFDDDCRLAGTRSAAMRLIRFLSERNGGYACYKRNEFKLCAIHRSVAERHAIPDLDVEVGTGIEDYGFFERLRRDSPRLEFEYDWDGLKETSEWMGDTASCWDRRDISKLIRKTNVYIYGGQTENE